MFMLKLDINSISLKNKFFKGRMREKSLMTQVLYTYLFFLFYVLKIKKMVHLLYGKSRKC